jgi:hypothetical protein
MHACLMCVRCSQLYAPQTKILDGGTKRCVCVFEVLFKGVSTLFGRPLIENTFKNAYATFGSTLENSSFGYHKLQSSVHTSMCMHSRCSQDACMPDVCTMNVHKMDACLMCVQWMFTRCMHAWCVFDVHKMHDLCPAEIDTILCYPNEDFGRPSKHSGTYFQSTFQMNVAQIEYSRMWKALWKCVPECLLGLPKASFGEHKFPLGTPTSTQFPLGQST